MTPEHLRDLFRYMEWADAEVWRAVLAHDGARTDAKLRGLLAFTCTWCSAAFSWSGRTSPGEPAMQKASSLDNVMDFHAWVQPYYADVHRFLETLDAAMMARGVTMLWVGVCIRRGSGGRSPRRRLPRRFFRSRATRRITAVRSTRDSARWVVSRRSSTTSRGSGFGRPEPQWSQVMGAGSDAAAPRPSAAIPVWRHRHLFVRPASARPLRCAPHACSTRGVETVATSYISCATGSPAFAWIAIPTPISTFAGCLGTLAPNLPSEQLHRGHPDTARTPRRQHGRGRVQRRPALRATMPHALRPHAARRCGVSSAPGGLFFARLASNIGLEARVGAPAAGPPA